MPDKLVDAMNAVWKIALEIGCPVSVRIDTDNPWVHMCSIRDLERFPGEIIFKKRPSATYPYEACKKHNGVSIFCLVGQAEYERLRKAIIY